MKKHSCYRLFVEIKVANLVSTLSFIFYLNIIACLSIMFSYIG